MSDEIHPPSNEAVDRMLREALHGEEDPGTRPSAQAVEAYLSGNASDEQKEEVRSALADSASFREEFLLLAQDLRKLTGRRTEPDEDSDRREEPIRRRAGRTRNPNLRAVLAVAAVLVVLAYPAYVGMRTILRPGEAPSESGRPAVWEGDTDTIVLSSSTVRDMAVSALPWIVRVRDGQTSIPVLVRPPVPIGENETVRLVIRNDHDEEVWTREWTGFELPAHIHRNLGLKVFEVPVSLLPGGTYGIELDSVDRPDGDRKISLHFEVVEMRGSEE